MPRIAVIYPRANLDTVPSLVGAIELLARDGCAVDVFTMTEAGHIPPRFSEPSIQVRSLGVAGLPHPSAQLRGAVRRAGWLPPAARAPLARGYAALGAGLAHGSRWMARVRARQRPAYDLLIGVDPDGLATAHGLAGGAPVAYYSLELLLSHELVSPADAQLKRREIELSRRAPFVIVQDEERGRLLAEDNGLSSERLVLVPNAPPGPARRQPSRFWHAHFGFDPETRVVLHSGSLGDWTGIEQIVAGVPRWPEPWVLVIHTRYDAETSPYVEGLRAQADPRRVHFSLKPVPREDYDTLIDGGDVGLAFYVPTGESSYTQRNIQTIGLSSGKLAYYLRAGLPVIVNRDASIGPTLEAYGCGVAVSDAAAVGPALTTIQPEIERYSGRALAFFDDRLDFARAFRGVIERVHALPIGG